MVQSCLWIAEGFTNQPQIILSSTKISGSRSNYASISLCASIEKEQESENELLEQAFLDQCAMLCQERNLPLENVKNARDLASIQGSPVIPGRLFRTGRVSDASASDIALLFDELNVTTLVDLRSPTELKDDTTLMREEVYGNFTNLLWRERKARKEAKRENRHKKDPSPEVASENEPELSKEISTPSSPIKHGCVIELESGQLPLKKHFWNRYKVQKDEDGEEDPLAQLEDDLEMVVECESCQEPHELEPQGDRKERYFVSLMNELKYVKGTVSKVRKRDMAKSLLKSPGALVSKRVRDSCKKPFLDEINGGGLPMVNDMLLRFGAPGIKYVLELCADRNRHPVAFYCTAGKDRTGVITALILKLCGVSTEAIVEDYTLSANVYAQMNDHKAMVGALSQRNLDPKTFLGAPAYVMQDTLDALEAEYGSVEEYLEWIGFSKEKQQALKDACMKE